jgi:hypothetical protein
LFRLTHITRHAALLLLVLAAACQTDPGPGQTAAAVNVTLGTQAAIRRATATFAADRRLVTQVALENAATLARRRQDAIISTLEELGLPPPDLSRITPAALPTNPALVLPTPTNDIFDIGGITRAAPTVDPASFTEIPPTDLPLVETATPDPSAPRVENVVTSTGVGPDDCATDVTPSFTTASPQIYVVATAYNIRAGQVIASRWLRDAEELTIFEFAPDFEIDGACIWFYAEPVDFPFNPGSYTVELLIDGQFAGTAQFTVQ